MVERAEFDRALEDARGVTSWADLIADGLTSVQLQAPVYVGHGDSAIKITAVIAPKTRVGVDLPILVGQPIGRASR